MQTTMPAVNVIPWAPRLMFAALVLTLACGFALPVSAQVTTVCSSTALCLDNAYLVTGDYVVGGVGLRGLGKFDPASGRTLATGTISIPDPNAYAVNTATGDESVPAGADIVAAYLYWVTVEKDQSTLAGQNGFFNGYAIKGTILGNQTAPTSWSSGGCSGNTSNSNGTTTMRGYRADVRPYLPLDTNSASPTFGNIQTPNAATPGHYQVMLADSGSNGGGTPLTLGASLVIVYRVLSPAKPLSAIVLYDGAASPSNTSSTLSQPILGFY